MGGINAISSLFFNSSDESIATYSILTATTIVLNNGFNDAYRSHIIVTHCVTLVLDGTVSVSCFSPTTSRARANSNTRILIVDDDDVVAVVVDVADVVGVAGEALLLTLLVVAFDSVVMQ